MKILICDTSNSVCSTGILENEKLISKNEIDNGKTHSENFMILVKKSLEDARLKLKDINAIGVVVGPGSFTGIRIGVSSLKAMAEVNNIKMISVYSLESLAANEYKSASVICSLIDARNNQVYCGIFDGEINKKEEFIADDIDVCLEVLKKYDDIIFVGDGTVLHKELIKRALNDRKIRFSEKNKQNAEGLGIIVYKKMLKGDFLDADSIIPVYLRKSQAERMKDRK